MGPGAQPPRWTQSRVPSTRPASIAAPIAREVADADIVVAAGVAAPVEGLVVGISFGRHPQGDERAQGLGQLPTRAVASWSRSVLGGGWLGR